MKRPTVVIPFSIRLKIRQQFYRISEHSIRNAIAWEQRLGAAIEGLADAPGHAVDERASKRFGLTIRKLTFEGKYLVHYVYDEAQQIIEIRGFRHGARRPRRGEP